MFSKSFCSSPWIHTRINNTGDFETCRWISKLNTGATGKNLAHMSPREWFQIGMKDFRRDLLQGKQPSACQNCQTMEAHHKVSGRQRQLLKTGIRSDDFVNTMHASPWLDHFNASMQHNGATELMPQDWQIDLGNYCNSACVMCSPIYSSRIASEYLRMGIIDSLPQRSWTDDPKLLEKFMHSLRQSPRLRYLHFIGGETMLTPGFKAILTALIDSDLHQDCCIGFTTNLTVWDEDINALLTQFRSVNLGLSIECLHAVNDYIRYPSHLETTHDLLQRWVNLAKKQAWLVQLRVTPTLLSIMHLHTVYDYAFQHAVSVEACNFLERPVFLRPSVLPVAYRRMASARLLQLCQDHEITDQQLINTRHPDLVTQQLTQDLSSYVHYLEHEPQQDGLPELVDFLHVLERSRNNRILDYLPEYEDLLRSAGYKN